MQQHFIPLAGPRAIPIPVTEPFVPEIPVGQRQRDIAEAGGNPAALHRRGFIRGYGRGERDAAARYQSEMRQLRCALDVIERVAKGDPNLRAQAPGDALRQIATIARRARPLTETEMDAGD